MAAKQIGGDGEGGKEIGGGSEGGEMTAAAA